MRKRSNFSASSACKNSLRLVDHGGARRVEGNSPDAGPYVGVAKGIAAATGTIVASTPNLLDARVQQPRRATVLEMHWPK
jgi:hypothetical protein